MLSGELMGTRGLSGEIQKEMIAGGGASDYNELPNKPQINGVELVGNKTAEDLGLANKSDIPVVPTKVSAFENDAEYLKEVPSEYVTETELNDAVKDKATINYVDTKVADLVNSAPETLDTLGELANAIKENQNVIDALNIPTKTSQLNNDSGFITMDDVPTTDLSNYYTKDEINNLVGNINTALENVLGV